MSNETANWLRRAADKIEPQGAWVKGALAKDESGREVNCWTEESACCWCMTAAMAVTQPGNLIGLELGQAIVTASRYVWRAMGRRDFETSMLEYNDAPERTQAECVAALRAGADLAETEVPHV